MPDTSSSGAVDAIEAGAAGASRSFAILVPHGAIANRQSSTPVSSYFYRDANAPEPNRPRRVTVVALIEHEGRLLLDRRCDAPFWGLIAGGLEDDESLLDGLRREIREETGLEIGNHSLFGTFSDPSRIVQYADGSIFQLVSVAYSVTVNDISGLRLSSEAVDLSFFSPDELPVNEIIATQRPIVERYLSSDLPPFLD